MYVAFHLVFRVVFRGGRRGGDDGGGTAGQGPVVVGECRTRSSCFRAAAVLPLQPPQHSMPQARLQ